MSNRNAALDRTSFSRRFRIPAVVAGAAVISLSLLLSVSPVMGAGGAHGTSGNVKVQDAATGVEATGSDNDPHVCSFRLVFTFDAPFEAGTWVVVSVAPTGNGTAVFASGTYDTAGDGMDSSSVIALSAGHYRVDWAAAGATSKKKTFWVDACAVTPPVVESPPEELPPTEAPSSPDEDVPVDESPVDESPADELPPTEAPSSSDEEAPVDESQAEDLPPTDAPSSPDEESPVGGPDTDELVLAGEGTSPQDEEPGAEEAPASDAEGTDVVEEPTIPEDTAPEDAPNVEEPAQAEDPGSIGPEHPPAQDVLGGIGAGDEPTMPDSATPVVPGRSGALVVLGLLAVAFSQAVVRRRRASDRDVR